MKYGNKGIFILSFLMFFGLWIVSTQRVYALDSFEPRITKVEGECALSKSITVTVNNLSGLLTEAKNELAKIILYLNGYPMKGITPRLAGGNSDQIVFDLKRTPESEKSWDSLLGRPKGFSKYITITVGLENKPLDTDITKYSLNVIHGNWFGIYVAILGLSIALFVMLAIYSDMLRDAGPQPAGINRRGKPNRRPFSLARTQMAVWFFLVIASYVFIWMVTTAYGTLTSSVLALIGISASTMLGATIIDFNKRNETDSLLKTRQLEEAKLQAEIANLSAALNATPSPANLDNVKKELAEKTVRLNQVHGEIQGFSSTVSSVTSEGFFIDILSDANGISFYRFQMASWTVVLGVIFISSVLNVLTMPEFPKELLALMGISSGTYIGFKFPEKQ
mgnify:CR=1 FL=1